MHRRNLVLKCASPSALLYKSLIVLWLFVKESCFERRVLVFPLRSGTLAVGAELYAFQRFRTLCFIGGLWKIRQSVKIFGIF